MDERAFPGSSEEETTTTTHESYCHLQLLTARVAVVTGCMRRGFWHRIEAQTESAVNHPLELRHGHTLGPEHEVRVEGIVDGFEIYEIATRRDEEVASTPLSRFEFGSHDIYIARGGRWESSLRVPTSNGRNPGQ